MQINTKFNIGDKVYWYESKHIIKGEVVEIFISIEGGETNKIIYDISNGSRRMEECLSKTKEESIESLLRYIKFMNGDVT